MSANSPSIVIPAPTGTDLSDVREPFLKDAAKRVGDRLIHFGYAFKRIVGNTFCW